MFYCFEREREEGMGREKEETQISRHSDQEMNHKPRHKPQIWTGALTRNRTPAQWKME